ncbi:MAG: DUF3617 family protein [Pseudomonadales bacterium]|jgi:hypothetical protein
MVSSQDRTPWRGLVAALLLAAGMTGAAAAATARAEAEPADGKPQPGAYEITTTTTYTDVPLPDSTLTTSTCLAKADMDEDPASILAALPDGAACSVLDFVMAQGEIRMRVACDSAQSSMTVVTSGSYHEQGWHLDSDVTVTVGADQVKMHSTIASRRTGDC